MDSIFWHRDTEARSTKIENLGRGYIYIDGGMDRMGVRALTCRWQAGGWV